MKMNKKVLLGMTLAGAFVLSGCANKTEVAPTNTTATQTAQTTQKTQTTQETQPKVIVKKVVETKIIKEEVNNPYPPNAQPGHCYAKVVIPPKYKTETKRVLVRDAGERIKIIPAKFKPATEQVLVREEAYRILPSEPVYKTVTKKVLVKPETKKYVVVPAKYKTVTEKVLVEPAHTVWKKGEALNGSKVTDIMCYVKVPAKYKTITKRVLVEPAHVKEVTVPAVYKTIKVKVVDRNATCRKQIIPAKKANIRVYELAQEPKVLKETIPAQYRTVTERVKVENSKLVWQPIVCKTNLTRDLVIKLQKALKAKGYYKGPIDGIYGRLTTEAVNAYQKDNNLASGALTLETLKKLGIEYKN
jgi:hypothetical protein